MARVHLDDIAGGMSFDEHLGAVTRLSRRAIVTELTPYTREQGGPYRTLSEALNHPDMPKQGNGLTSLPGTNTFAHLRLSGRSPKLHKDHTTCVVDLIYEPVTASGNQSLDTAGIFGARIFGEHRSALVSKKTNKYRVNGIGPEITIGVEHTYPRLANDHRPGVLKTQGGEIEIMEPQKNYRFSGYRSTYFPWVLEDALHGVINSAPWLNKVPFAWMCTEVKYKMIKEGRYLFEFEFQSNEDLWVPRIVFIDEETGRPPLNLVEGVGKKSIPYYRIQDFNLVFNAIFESWTFLP